VETIAGGREVKTLSGSISPPPTFRSQWDVRRGREAALEAVSCANSANQTGSRASIAEPVI